jgi:threonine dehydratase
MSAARRNAETILNQSQKRQETFKLEQKQALDAMKVKTERLRELRLAKEADEKVAAEKAAAVKAAAASAKKPRRSKQTST